MAKNLTCGCCGCCFMTWPGYEDQDQDKGFGICKDCQQWIKGRNEKQLDELAAKIRDALNETNREKWDKLDPRMHRLLALEAIDEGFVTWSIP